MNVKRYLAAAATAFVFIFVFEYLWHARLLGDLYRTTQALWRPEAEMGIYFPLIPLYQALMALVISSSSPVITKARASAKGYGSAA